MYGLVTRYGPQSVASASVFAETRTRFVKILFIVVGARWSTALIDKAVSIICLLINNATMNNGTNWRRNIRLRFVKENMQKRSEMECWLFEKYGENCFKISSNYDWCFKYENIYDLCGEFKRRKTYQLISSFVMLFVCKLSCTCLNDIIFRN